MGLLTGRDFVSFLNLTGPICCAIPKNHPLCDHKRISMHDLDNQHIVTIPLDTDLTLPYGLMYANEPNEALKKFLRIVKKLTW